MVHQGALAERDGRRVAIAVLSDGNPSIAYGERTIEGVGPRLLTRRRARTLRVPRRRSGSTAPMDPVSETPTEPVDYAALNAVWGAMATGLLLATRDDAPPARELPVFGLATFAITKALAKEKVGTWVRDPLVDERSHRPKGRRLRYAAGELLTCTRCLGTWSSLGPHRPARRPAPRGPHPGERPRHRGHQRLAAVGLHAAVQPRERQPGAGRRRSLTERFSRAGAR